MKERPALDRVRRLAALRSAGLRSATSAQESKRSLPASQEPD